MRRSTSQSLLALRTWWPALALGAVVGAAIGPLTTVHAPYSATSELRVDIAGLNDSGQQSAIQTALQLVDSNESYVDAIAYEGVHNDIRAAQELRTRSVVASANQSALLSITITAPTVEQAERQADDVAKGAIDYIHSLAEVQFTDTVAAGQKALDAGQVPDKVAEQARREALGQGVASQQDEALKFSAQLSRVGAVQPAVRAGLGASTAGVVGALAGLLVGALLALALGIGRRRVRNVSDLRRVSELVSIEPRRRSDGLIRAAARAARQPYPFVVVLALPGAEGELESIVESLRLELTDEGRKVHSIVESDLVPAGVLALTAGTTAEGSIESETTEPHISADEPAVPELTAEESLAAETRQVESTPAEPTLDSHFPLASQWATSRPRPLLPSPRPRVSLERSARPEVVLEKVGGSSGSTATATMDPEQREDEPQPPSFVSKDDVSAASFPIASNGSGSNGSGSNGAASNGADRKGTADSRPRPQAVAATDQGHKVRSPRPPAVSMPRRAEDLVALGADVLLLAGDVAEQPLADLADRADVVVIVARRRVTRYRHIVDLAGEIETVTPIVVLNDR